MTLIPTDVSASRSRVSSTALADSRLIPSARAVSESGSRSIASAMCSVLTRRSPRRFASALASRYTWPMNYWWDTHAYQQSNKISPPNATGCTRSVSVMIASMSIMARPALTGTDPACGWRQRLSGWRHVGGDQAGPAGPVPADARDILDELTKRNVKLSLGGSNP
jgi:hypothetical protein